MMRRMFLEKMFSSHFESVHSPGARRELIDVNSKALQDRDEQVRERIVPIPIEADMLTVFEAATGQDRWQVGGEMLVSVSHIRPVKNHGAIEQRFAAFLSGSQIA